jgi:hypothetical protein
VFLTANSRQRDLDQRLSVWGPRIGETATRTTLRSYWYGQFGFVVVNLWLAVALVFEFLTESPVPIAIITVICWPVVIWAFARSVQLIRRAGFQAAEVTSTTPSARPPVKNVGAFDRWAQESPHSRRFASSTHLG